MPDSVSPAGENMEGAEEPRPGRSGGCQEAGTHATPGSPLCVSAQNHGYFN